MHWQPWFMHALIVVIFIGLARDVAATDILLLGGTILAGLAGIIKPADIFAGFANPNMLMVGALFAWWRPHSRDWRAQHRWPPYARQNPDRERRLVRMLVALTVSSAFLNNTPIVAMFLPVVLEWCRKHRVSPSRLLMPISFLTILGGICTLIGTSTNLVVNGLMVGFDAAHADLPPASRSAAPSDEPLRTRQGRFAHGHPRRRLSC